LSGASSANAWPHPDCAALQLIDIVMDQWKQVCATEKWSDLAVCLLGELLVKGNFDESNAVNSQKSGGVIPATSIDQIFGRARRRLAIYRIEFIDVTFYNSSTLNFTKNASNKRTVKSDPFSVAYT
jgi:hypothetical protein